MILKTKFVKLFQNLKKFKAMRSILEKNPLNGRYILYTSLNNGFAWFFEDLRTAKKAREKLDVLIAKKLNLSYKEVTIYILSN